jgi:two-component system chemotaxis response regulator CheB
MTFQLVVVGASLGGLQALEVLLAGLPRNFPVPVAIVQHRHKSSDDKLRMMLQQYTPLVVIEPQDKEEIVPGCIYLAPADYHLMIEAGSDSVPYPCFSLSTDAPVTYARPSIDVLFETAADTYAEKLIGVLLTGANHDGSWRNGKNQGTRRQNCGRRTFNSSLSDNAESGDRPWCGPEYSTSSRDRPFLSENLSFLIKFFVNFS